MTPYHPKLDNSPQKGSNDERRSHSFKGRFEQSGKCIQDKKDSWGRPEEKKIAIYFLFIEFEKHLQVTKKVKVASPY